MCNTTVLSDFALLYFSRYVVPAAIKMLTVKIDVPAEIEEFNVRITYLNTMLYPLKPDKKWCIQRKKSYKIHISFNFMHHLDKKYIISS